MDLKSRMSLDISGVTKNLSKVASDTSTLARKMSSAFVGVKNDLADLNSALQVDKRVNGSFNTLVQHVATLGDKLTAPFKKMYQQASISFSSLSGNAAKAIAEIEARFDSVGALSKMASSLRSFVSKNIFGILSAQAAKVGAAFSYVANGVLPSFKAALQSTYTGITKFTTGAVQPLVSAINSVNTKLKKWIANMNDIAYKGTKNVKELTEATKASGMQFKDVSRIVQGILISKIFYGSLNAIREATRGVYEFAQSLEYSQLVYTNFFGMQSEAKNFTTVLQDFASKTRFNFTQLNDAAQQLLAYGFQAKNLMYVLKGVSAAASISGDATKIEPISRALGQIYNKGKLMSEEIRQLNEANVPVFEILKEKLGLTAKQIQNIGDEAIPASTAINALLDGLNERFGGLLKYTNTTMLGISSNITDVWLQLAASVFEPFIAKMKNVLISVLNFLLDLKAVFETSGVGGIFEKLIPAELQDSVRLLLGNIIGIFSSLRANAQLILALVGQMLPGIVTWLNIILNTIGNVMQVFAAFSTVLLQNQVALTTLSKVLMVAAAAWLAYKVQAIAAFISAGLIKIVGGISKSLTVLSNTLTKLAQHPFLLMAVVLIGILLALTGSFDKVRASVNNLMNSFNAVQTSTILQPEKMDKSGNGVDKYSEKLDEMSKSLGKTADAAKKASKAFLSFDEVFSTPDESNSTEDDSDINKQWNEFLGGLSDGSFDPSSILAGIDVSDFAAPFVDSLIASFSDSFSSFGTSIVSAMKKAQVGNLILGGLIGALTLAVVGFTPAGIFLALSAVLAGAFWTDFATVLGLPPANVNVNTLIGGALTAALGLFILGFTPAGLFTAIGALIVGGFYDDLKKAFENATGTTSGFDTAVSDAIVIMILGAVTKAGLSTKIDAGAAALGIILVQKILKEIGNTFGKDPKEIDEASVAAASSGILGFLIAAVSGVAALPVTVLYAAVLGLATLFGDQLVQAFNDPNLQAVGTIGIATAIGTCIAGVPGALVGFLVGAAYTIVVTFWDEIARVFTEGWNTWTKGVSERWSKVSEYFTFDDKSFWDIGMNMIWGIEEGIRTALLDILSFIIQVVFAPLDQALRSAFGINSPAETMKPIGENIILGIFEGIKNIIATVGTWVVTNIFSPVINAIKTAFGINSPAETTKPLGENIMAGILSGIINKISTITTWVNDHIFTPMIKALKAIFGISKGNASGLEPTGKSIVSGIFTGISDNIAGLVKNIGGFAGTIANAFDGWISGITGKFSTMMSTIGTTVSTWVSGLASSISSGISGAAEAASKAASAVGNVVDTVVQTVTGKTTTTNNATVPKTIPKTTGHRYGGIFNKEHFARFAEDNKAEAIIPLENRTAMQPFVDAVSNGITQSLAPILVQMGGGAANNLPPMWVGALIADERGLKELKSKFKLMDATESVRRGEVHG